MRKHRRGRFTNWLVTAGMLLFLGAHREAQAAQSLRVQVDQKGDFLLIGNTLGYECAAGTPAPVVGIVGNCGNNGLADTAPDIFWQTENPAGTAQANNTVTAASSSAILTIPSNAAVTHAFLYWGATILNGDTTAVLNRPGGFSQSIVAMQTYTSLNDSYQSIADITAIVQAQGSGAYRVSGVDCTNVVNVNNSNTFAGWWMVVFYELPTDPPRNLALFDGFDNVSDMNPQNLMLSGFLVPPVFTAAKLGVVTFEGDNSITGDSFSFGPAPALSDASNPANNFFNGTRSFLGVPVSNTGDLPQLTGTAQSMSGMDIDVVDVTAKLMSGQTSVPISATSTQDNYYLAGFVTSIPTFKPDFSTSQKSAVDINGGSYFPGDIVEYTVVSTNTGNDTSINTVLTDPLPMGVTYVPGTLSITAGANTGAKTDMTGDDQCEYNMGTRTVVCRLGTGADAMNGGQLSAGDSSTVRFRVTIDANASGTIYNQAVITAAGLLGAPAEGTPTDGNGAANGGQPPTMIFVTHCNANAQCPPSAPYCDTAVNPHICVSLKCGNNVLEAAESCDDGNTTNGDGCNEVCLREIGQYCTLNSQCATSFCWTNGYVCACDDDSDCSSGFVCLITNTPLQRKCIPSGCGNTVQEIGEACDDGNTSSGDGCSAECLLEVGEFCDDAAVCQSGLCNNNTCACRTDADCPAEHFCAAYACIAVGCGDGLLTSTEICDDGNLLDGDGCDSNCTPTSCGNGNQTAGEDCDDGNLLDGDGCSASCETEIASGTGGAGNGTTNQPPGCACSTPGSPSSSVPFWLAALPLVLCARRQRRR